MTIFHSIKEVLPITVIPITLATLIMILNFACRSKKLSESLPFVLMQLNTLFVWINTGVTMLYPIDFASANINQYTIYYIIDSSFLLEVVSIFIYTWTFLDVVVDNLTEGCIKRCLQNYQKISIITFPMITYGLYFVYSPFFAKEMF